jgi:hypothetical protein
MEGRGGVKLALQVLLSPSRPASPATSPASGRGEASPARSRVAPISNSNSKWFSFVMPALVAGISLRDAVPSDRDFRDKPAMTTEKPCVSGPCFGQATGVPVFPWSPDRVRGSGAPQDAPFVNSAPRAASVSCPLVAQAACVAGVRAKDADNAHARRRSTAATFGSSGPVPIRPDRGSLTPAGSRLRRPASSATRRAPVVGPDGAPEASRGVIASHAAGAALPAPGLPGSGPVKVLHHQNAS